MLSRVQRSWPRLMLSLRTFLRYGCRLVLCFLEARSGRGCCCCWEPLKVWGIREVMVEADAVIENLLKVWMNAFLCFLEVRSGRGQLCHREPSKSMGYTIHTCSVLYRVQRLLTRLTLSLRIFWRYRGRLVLCCIESRGHGQGWRRHWEPPKAFFLLPRVKRPWPRLMLSLRIF